jgi:lysophospholipase L1-like esterase
VLCFHGAVAMAQPGSRQLRRFDEVEYVTCKKLPRFQSLWASGQQATIRLVILGDSQETSPGGAGRVYVPRLGYEFWKRYGNVPETQFNGAGTFGNKNDAGWLLRSNSGGPNPIFGRLLPQQLPPGIGQMRSHCSTNGLVNFTGQFQGQMDVVLPSGEALPSGCILPPGRHYFDINGPIAAQVFAATNPSSGEVYFRARPQNGIYATYWGSVTTEGRLEMGLESPSFAVKSGLTPPLDRDGQPFLGVEISGDNDAKLTDIIGMRLVNTGNPRGVAITPLCAGGYQTRNFLQNHHACGPVLAALGFNAAMICYGANDASSGVSAAAFQADVRLLMAWVRQMTGDPHFPFILVSDPDRAFLTPSMRAQFDYYPAAMRAIALADEDVMAVNARRMMHERGWREDSPQFRSLASDGVHYSDLGARVLAREVVDAILTGPGWHPRITLSPSLPPP